MELWLDTTNISAIINAASQGVLHGVTTNPTLVARSGGPMRDVLRELLRVQGGPVTAQVTENDAAAMIRQGRTLRSFSKRIIVKVPITGEGLEAIHVLSRRNIPTMATVVFHPNQALLAARAGARYVAPYLGRMLSVGKDGLRLVGDMHHIMQTYQFDTKILAASIKTPEQVTACALMGIPAMTISEAVFLKLVHNPQTSAGIKQFLNDWKKAKPTHLRYFP